MEIGEKINVLSLEKGRRFVWIEDTLRWLKKDIQKFWCWGVPRIDLICDKKKEIYCIQFFVTGRLHRGHVYIAVNGNDLIDIYYTTQKGTIKHIDNDIYIDNLNEVIDNKIERIKQYVK